jgi:hypothetical protein
MLKLTKPVAIAIQASVGAQRPVSGYSPRRGRISERGNAEYRTGIFGGSNF